MKALRGVLGAVWALLVAATIYVQDDPPNHPAPGNPAVSDPLEDGTPAHPYDAIQEAGGGFCFDSRETAAAVVDRFTLADAGASDGIVAGSARGITCTIAGHSAGNGADGYRGTDGGDLPGRPELKRFASLTAADPACDQEPDRPPNLEQYEHATSPNDPDTDDDGLGDADEVSAHGADPEHSYTCDYTVSACTWKGGRAGAVTLCYDDGYMSSFEDRLALDVYGFKATYFVYEPMSRQTPLTGRFGRSGVQTLYDEGHEIGCHSYHHWCDYYNWPDLELFGQLEYGAWYTLYLATFPIPEKDLRFSLAYPCGARNEELDAVASQYTKSVRGYLSLGHQNPGALVGLNPATPPSPNNVMVLSVYSPNVGDNCGSEKEFAMRAIAEGGWAIYVSHSTMADLDPTLLQDIAPLDVWVAPQGRVVEYLTMRDHVSVTDLEVQASGPATDIQFTISDDLDDALYDDPITMKVKIAADDEVGNVEVNGIPVAWQCKAIGGDRCVIFDSVLTGSPHVAIALNDPERTYYVNGESGSDAYDGRSPVYDGVHGPKLTIQAGIDATVGGWMCVVQVADGTYTGVGNKDLDFGGKAITVRSENGPDVTIVDCEGAGRGFHFHSGETAESILDGFTVTNGDASEGGGICCLGCGPTIINCKITSSTADWHGGGIFCFGSDAQITSTTVAGNNCGWQGGGIACEGSSPTISDCVIVGNAAGNQGGGIHCYLSSPDVVECEINDNSAVSDGGGLCSTGGSPEFAGCTICGNAVGNDGGGVDCDDSALVLVGCVVSDNTAGHEGGGVWFSLSDEATVFNCTITGNSAVATSGGIGCASSSPSITNCTISANSLAACLGGGVGCFQGSSPTVTNCILWANLATTGHEIALAGASALTIRYSDVEGGAGQAYIEAGCTLDMDASDINQDPLFVCSGGFDYYLSQTGAGQASDSPCVDAGSDTAVSLGLEERTTRTDLEPDSGIVDMGCHPPSTYAFRITDVCWDQTTTATVLTFSSLADVEYVIETAEADAYTDGLAWADWTTVTAVGETTTVTDDLSANPLTHAFRFYRVKRADGTGYSRQTAGVFELPINAAATTLYFISTPLVPDPDHDSVADVFGEGAGRQVPRTNFTVSDLNESSGAISRMRNASGTYSVLAGSAFAVQPGLGYEVYLGTGVETEFKLRLTGYVPETSLTVPLTKESGQAIRWMGYSMLQTIKLSALGLVEAVTPSWNSTNRVRLLPPGSSAWGNYTYSTTTRTWSPSDPNLVPGMGIVFIRQGFPNCTDQLVLQKWYVAPPNE